MQKGSLVIKEEVEMYGILMRDSGRRVEREWQGLVSEGKRRRIGASETNEESKTRRGIRRHTKTERISPKPDRCRELTTLWVARLDDGTELKVTDPKEQQGDVEEKEAEDEERRDRVDGGRRRAGCCWRRGSFEGLQCGG